MEITNQIHQVYVPQAALIVYHMKDNSSSGSYYLESRNIKSDGTLGVAKPVSRKFMTALVKNFKDVHEMHPCGPIPTNMLYADPTIGVEKYIWWNPPARKTLYFHKETGMEEAEYNMPGTIFVIQNNKLSVYAYKGKRPVAKTQLLHGPFYNYYNNGSVCTGNARKQWPSKIHWSDIIEHWEAIFWNSINSHTIDNPMKKGYVLNTELKKSMDAPFDTDTLRETKINLESLLK